MKWSVVLAELVLSLSGNFHLRTAEGTEIRVSSRRGRALIARLALCPRMEMGRRQIADMLWCEGEPQRVAVSMRGLLRDIRRALGPHADALVAQGHLLRLTGTQLDGECSAAALFFADAPDDLGEEFDDWLRLERSKRERRVPRPGPEPSCGPVRTVVAIMPPRVISDDLGQQVVAARLTELIVSGLRGFDLADILDLRSLCGEDETAPIPQHRPQIAVDVSLASYRSFLQLGVRALELPTRKVLWSATLASDHAANFLITQDEVLAFAAQAIDALHAALTRRAESGGGSQVKTLLGAAHRIFQMNPGSQFAARAFLKPMLDMPDAALARAWDALAIVHLHGEGEDAQASRDEAEARSRQALEAGQHNPVVLAVCGHVEGFLLRRLDRGAELCGMALRLAPHLALVNDFAAMNALYRCDLAAAQQLSDRAMALAGYSPWRSLYQAGAAMVATVDGRHDTAIRLGRSVLSRLPRFLAVERHMLASLVAVGRHHEAHHRLSEIRRRDPAFELRNIGDPAYPVPSPASVIAIRQALQTI